MKNQSVLAERVIAESLFSEKNSSCSGKGTFMKEHFSEKEIDLLRKERSIYKFDTCKCHPDKKTARILCVSIDGDELLNDKEFAGYIETTYDEYSIKNYSKK